MSTHQQKQSFEKWMKWAQQGNPSSHWTTALSDRWFSVAVGLLFFAHLLLAHYLPLAEDELYYWSWAQKLSPSYFDHPPMTAVWIALSTKIFGNSAFGIRFPAVLAHTLVFVLLGKLCPTKTLIGLLLFTPLSLFGSLLMTPDIPLLVFWCLYLYWLCSVESTFSGWSDDPVTRVYRSMPVGNPHWILGGLILGLGALSKYTMALSLPCSFLLLISRYRLRAWWKGYAVHLLIAGILCIPILYFNYQHQFEPLKYQWEHTHWEVGFSFLFSFLGSQVLLVGALPFLFLPWVLVTIADARSVPVMRVCLYFFLLPLTFFLYQATKNYMEANWALPAYMSFWPLASYLIQRTSFRGIANGLTGLAFSVPLIASLLILGHLVHPLSFIAANKDRVAKLSGQFQVFQSVANDIRANELKQSLYLPTYQLTSYFRYFGFSDARQIFPLGRPSQFTLTANQVCDEPKIVALFPKVDGIPDVLRCFKHVENLREYPVTVRGEETDRYVLYSLEKETSQP